MKYIIETNMVGTPKSIDEITGGAHILGEFSDVNGPTLIVFGGVHGNEAGGVKAIKRVVPKLEELKTNLKGRVYLLSGNTRALAKGIRFIDSDLNRHFTVGNLRKNSESEIDRENLSEDLELIELMEIMHEVLGSAHDEVYALDLHSTSADGVPFGTVGDTLRNRHFAEKFPITFLLGIEEQLEGTILEYLNGRGTVTLGFEGGQHFADSTTNNHEALIWLALVNSRVLAASDVADLNRHRQTLESSTGGKRIIEIRYRHAITEQDDFEMNPGFGNFQPVTKGELLGKDIRGDLRANESGLILMPLYQKLGEDGYFLGREVAPFWLRLSEFLRRINLPRFVKWLPGVRRHETEEGVYRVNTRIAAIFPLQVFHLLGFRKRRQTGSDLIVSRRLFDTKSPFSGK